MCMPSPTCTFSFTTCLPSLTCTFPFTTFMPSLTCAFDCFRYAWVFQNRFVFHIRLFDCFNFNVEIQFVASNYCVVGLIVTSCAYPSTFWRTLLGNSTILWCPSSSRLVGSRSGHGCRPVIQSSSYQSSGCGQFPFCKRYPIAARIKPEISTNMTVAFRHWNIMQEKEYVLVFGIFWT
jgi:hypothetical protein